jgi:hypothetical protein
MSHTYSDNDMKKALKKWNAQAIDNEKLKPNMRKWKKGLFGGWTWIGEGAPESYGSWVTYSGTKTIQTSMQEYDTISTTIYIWEGPEPPGGRPPRPDLTPEAVAARTAWQMEEAAARAAARSPEAVAKRKRELNAYQAEREARAAAEAAQAADTARKEKYNRCIADFGPFQQEYKPISGGTRKKRKNRDTKKKRSRRYK